MGKFTKDLCMITLGSLCYALALTLLAIPNNLTEGGVPGAAIILHYAFDWSPGIVTFILTSVIMIIGYKSLPKRAIVLSLLSVPLVSIFIYISEDLVESLDRKSTRLNSSHVAISYAVFCLRKNNTKHDCG